MNTSKRRSNWFWSIVCDKANALDKFQIDSVQRWETNCSLKDDHFPCTNVIQPVCFCRRKHSLSLFSTTEIRYLQKGLEIRFWVVELQCLSYPSTAK